MFISSYCAELTSPQLCEQTYLPCCEHFVSCNVGPGLECISNAD